MERVVRTDQFVLECALFEEIVLHTGLALIFLHLDNL